MDLKQRWNAKSMQWLLALYIVIALVASAQDLLHTPKAYSSDGRLYTEYNNYVIFKHSFFHLVDGKNLYEVYPDEHWDLFKYSPAFSPFFSVFAYFPDYIGLTLWSLLNALIVFFAISRLPGFTIKQKNWMLLYCIIELLGSLQNTQSNGLMAGLIILSFVFLEKSNYFLAAFCVVFSIYIKIFGAVAFAMFLLYPNKLKLAAYTLFWMLFMAAIPALVTGFTQLGILYKYWFALLREDHLASQGLGLVGIINSWFHVSVSKNMVVLVGMVLFCIPLARVSQYKNFQFRVLLLASVLLWTIVFNHKAESPTFIISMCGMAIWYCCKDRGRLDTVLAILAFVFTTLSVSDLFPRTLKEEFIRPYSIKGLMSVVIWAKIIYEMVFEAGKVTPVREMISTATGK
jgi:hypothetical protein